jgi:hypothetical protein
MEGSAYQRELDWLLLVLALPLCFLTTAALGWVILALKRN